MVESMINKINLQYRYLNIATASILLQLFAMSIADRASNLQDLQFTHQLISFTIL